MKDRGAITERKEKQHVYYRITNQKIIEGYKLIREGIIEIQKSKSKLLDTDEEK